MEGKALPLTALEEEAAVDDEVLEDDGLAAVPVGDLVQNCVDLDILVSVYAGLFVRLWQTQGIDETVGDEA